MIGDSLIVVAQLLAAAQIVYEEKFICRYDVSPILACGLEGNDPPPFGKPLPLRVRIGIQGSSASGS